MTGLPSILVGPPAPRVPRDLSTGLLRLGRLSLWFEPGNLWVGLRFAPEAVWLHLVPVLGLKWERRLKAAQGRAERPSGWMPGDWG